MAVYRAVLEAGRHDPRDEPRPRRPPDARQPGQLLGQALQGRFPTACARTTERIDYDQVRELAREHRPKLIRAAPRAYSRVIDFEAFREIADEVGAVLMADIAHIAGLVAAGVHPSPGRPCAARHDHHAQDAARSARRHDPVRRGVRARRSTRAVFPGGQGGPLMHVIAGKAVAFLEAAQPGFRVYCEQIVANARALADRLAERGFRVVSGGTDVHLFLLSLVDREVNGKQAQQRLEHAGITTNKNMVPFDPRKPTVTSGVRIGTPAVTTRGMKEAEMAQIAGLVARVLEQAGRRGGDRRGARRSRGAVPPLPALRLAMERQGGCRRAARRSRAKLMRRD